MKKVFLITIFTLIVNVCFGQSDLELNSKGNKVGKDLREQYCVAAASNDTVGKDSVYNIYLATVNGPFQSAYKNGVREGWASINCPAAPPYWGGAYYTCEPGSLGCPDKGPKTSSPKDHHKE